MAQDANTNGSVFDSDQTIDRLWEDVEDGYTNPRVLSTSGMMDMAEREAYKMGASEAPRDFCAMCAEHTPLAYENASDIGAIKRFEALEATVSQLVLAIDYNIPADEHEALHAHSETHWVGSQLTDAYEDGFRDGCAETDACEVCTHPDEYDGCGHTDNGDTCPAQ